MFDKSKIAGPVFPIITPFTKDGYVDYDAVTKYIDFLCKAGAKTLYVMAHSSRVGLLKLGELISLNRLVCTYTHLTYPGVIVIASAPMYGGIDAFMDVAGDACIAGVDLLSVLFTERYYSDEQVVEFFAEIAENNPCGILVHEEPFNALAGSQKVQWPISLLENVIKQVYQEAFDLDSHDDAYTAQVIEAFKDDVAIIVSGGGKEQFLKFAPVGCPAYLVGVGSFAPEIAISFYANYSKANLPFINAFIAEVERPFFAVAMKLGWHIALKSAMEHMGIMRRYERMPLKALNEEDHIKIGKLLLSLGFGKEL